MHLNLKRALKIMEKYDLDALVASKPENTYYASDFWSLSQWTLSGVSVFAVLPRDSEPALIMPHAELDLYADKPSWIKDVHTYGTFYIEPPETENLMEPEKRLAKLIREVKSEKAALDALTNVLKDRGLDSKALGVDEAGMTCASLDELKRKLPAAHIKNGTTIFKEIRMVKTSEEIEKLSKAAEVSEKALRTALQTVKEGISEADLARIFETDVAEEGGRPWITVFGCGSRSAFPNCVPSSYKLKKGDIVRFDGGCVYDDYASDLAYSGVFGQPTEKHKKYYTALLKGTTEAIKSIKPGVKASALFRKALETTIKAGIPHYKRHHVGHGIGIEVYDMPLLRATDNTPLEEGMVLNLETPYYEIGFGGLQVEQTVAVTVKGSRYLTTPVEELPII